MVTISPIVEARVDVNEQENIEIIGGRLYLPLFDECLYLVWKD
jgi:hypothetical protein